MKTWKQLTPKEKSSGVGCLVLIGLVVVIFATCSRGCGGDKEETAQERVDKWHENNAANIREKEQKYKKDSTALYMYIYDNCPDFGKQKGVKVEISELDESNCNIEIVIPKNFAGEAKDIANAACILSARWLSKNNFDLASVRPKVTVLTRTIGVTGRSGLPMYWGVAQYQFIGDCVTWDEGI